MSPDEKAWQETCFYWWELGFKKATQEYDDRWDEDEYWYRVPILFDEEWDKGRKRRDDVQ